MTTVISTNDDGACWHLNSTHEADGNSVFRDCPDCGSWIELLRCEATVVSGERAGQRCQLAAHLEGTLCSSHQRAANRPPRAICQATKRDGTPCRLGAVRGTERCLFHRVAEVGS